MPRLCCLLLCFSSLVFAQTSNPHSNVAPSHAVEVFYVVNNSTLTTYNIDPQTLDPDAVGTTAIPGSQSPYLVTSPNGQFLYYVTRFENSANDRLYVYGTNAMGVPGSAPAQTLNASHVEALAANPGANFLYSVIVGPPGQTTTEYAIVRSTINPANGTLSRSAAEATYQLDSVVSANDCYLSLMGFNPAGTMMYDAILCSGPHGSGSGTYNQRTVNLQTGALGPDQQIYSFSYYAGSAYANVQVENNLMFTFVQNFNQGPNANLVDVYQLPNTSPAINCTATMWAVCGDFTFSLAHPSGEYVFLQDPSNIADIGQVNLETQQILPVNNLPFEARMFSPDGKLVFGPNPGNNGEIDLAGFNPANAEVKLGGTIDLPNSGDYWTVAERY